MPKQRRGKNQANKMISYLNHMKKNELTPKGMRRNCQVFLQNVKNRPS
jgi:hypothetical protein